MRPAYDCRSPEERLRPKDGGELGPDTLDVAQHRRRPWRWLVARRVSASRSASTALICSISSSSRSSSRPIWTLRCIGKGRPSPVLSPSSRRRRSRRNGSYPDTPWENSKPLMRFTCLTRSAISTLRSRQISRRSSSSGAGALTIAHTRGSPRLYASSVRSSASPSILSVFARRRRREVAIEAGSTTWLSIPSFSRTR